MLRALWIGIVLVASCKGREPAPEPKAKTTAAATVQATAAFVDVTVVPMDGDRELAHQTVLVDGTKIVAVGPTASTPVPPQAAKIDGQGKWLVPGLIDMHVHLNDDRYAVLFVANGVTTVRNMWGDEHRLAWRDKARANDPSYVGPSIVTAGSILDGDPPIWPGSQVLRDAAAAEAAVAAHTKAGYDLIKVYDGIPREAYDALAAAARKAGIRFAGHVPRAVPLSDALRAGQASIEHLSGYQRAVEAGTPLAELARATAEAKVANVPTLVVLERFATFDRPNELRARSENKYVAPQLLATWDPSQDFRTKNKTAEEFEAMRARRAFHLELVKSLSDAGAPILAGTDTPNPFVVPGFSLHEELALLVEAGMTPYQALHAATAGPADWLGAKDLGRIAVGARADLVLLDADPRKDISATTKRAGVMLRGTWFTTQQLETKLDELVASYRTADDRFATAPALDVPEGELVFTGTYMTTFAGTPFAEERLAIVRTKDGGRIIVAQAAGEPPSPKLASVRVELDRKGNLRAFSIEEDGKRATATPSGATLQIAAGGASSEIPLAEAPLVDGNFVATMIPFADRAKEGAKITVAGKSLAGTGKLSNVAYSFERAGLRIPFTVTSMFGEARGTYEVDAQGIPTSIKLQAGPGEIVITRK